MYKILQRHRVECTRWEVREVYRRFGMLGKRAPNRVRTTDSRHEHERYANIVKKLKVERPNQVWVADTTELRVGSARAFLALIEDVFTRRVVGLAISLANNTSLTLEALDKALAGATPEIHHSDQGKTYASLSYTQTLLDKGVLISMATAGCAWENGFAERLNRTFKREEIRRSEYQSIREARRAINAYAKIYNEQRLHMSLGYTTPNEASEAYTRQMEQGE